MTAAESPPVDTSAVRIGDRDAWRGTSPCLRRDPDDVEAIYTCLAPRGHVGPHAATDGVEVFHTWPANENAPAALARGEGNDQNTNHEAGEPDMTSVPSTDPVWHPIWCDPDACIVDSTDGTRVHRGPLVTHAQGAARATARLVAADDGAAEVDMHLSAEGASVDDVRAVLADLTGTARWYAADTR